VPAYLSCTIAGWKVLPCGHPRKKRHKVSCFLYAGFIFGCSSSAFRPAPQLFLSILAFRAAITHRIEQSNGEPDLAVGKAMKDVLLLCGIYFMKKLTREAWCRSFPPASPD